MKRSRRWSFFKSQAEVREKERERERETVESVAILGFLPHRSISDFSLSVIYVSELSEISIFKNSFSNLFLPNFPVNHCRVLTDTEA